MSLEANEKPCPECGAAMRIKHVGQDSFWACSAYPKCQHTQPLHDSQLEPQSLGVECPQCGGELLLKQGRYGFFVGCANFPDCHFVAEADSPEQTEVDCPECESGRLVERTSKYGKRFYACNQYPSCQFAVNYPPLAKVCPACDYPVMMKKQQQGRAQLVCARKSCGHKLEDV
ncbi:type I DNA topoisomerase [Idiomarina xiamenensis]|nr:type I DNA topoisomerase [Idiomarina xiamenensis]